MSLIQMDLVEIVKGEKHGLKNWFVLPPNTQDNLHDLCQGSIKIKKLYQLLQQSEFNKELLTRHHGIEGEKKTTNNSQTETAVSIYHS